MKKLFVMLMILMIVLVVGGCTRNNSNNNYDLSNEVVTPLSHGDSHDNNAVVRDLGGLEITIARMFSMSAECTDTFLDNQWLTDNQRMRWEDRLELEKLHNFRVRYVNYIKEPSQFAGMASMLNDFYDGMKSEIREGNRNYTVWTVNSDRFFLPNSKGLFAPIPTELFTDDDERAWNKSVWETTMLNGIPRAFSLQDERWPTSGGVFFNMRIFEQAGLPRDLLFTLQASGNWTWDTFTDVARQVFAGQNVHSEIVPFVIISPSDLVTQALIANNADFAMIDSETGRFIDTSNTPEFFMTFEWLVQLRDEGLVYIFGDNEDGRPIGSWHAFNEGRAAMLAVSFHANTQIPYNDLGFVAFPTGPSADEHYSIAHRHHFYTIPNFFSPEEVDEIIYALRLWYRPLDSDDVPDWMVRANELFAGADPRSINETMVNFTEDPELQRISSIPLMPQMSDMTNPFPWTAWEWVSQWARDRSAQEIIDSNQATWQDYLERINNSTVGSY
ncbi:MAG: hypothetical protein FWF81_05985 [Defluviitaleaceae bacterium]|nr:hypothetical protein [Defluviitaleaceae bacterium]